MVLSNKGDGCLCSCTNESVKVRLVGSFKTCLRVSQKEVYTMVDLPSCCSEPLPLLPHTASAWRFFIVASSSAAGHPIEKGHAELKDSAKRSQVILKLVYVLKIRCSSNQRLNSALIMALLLRQHTRNRMTRKSRRLYFPRPIFLPHLPLGYEDGR